MKKSKEPKNAADNRKAPSDDKNQFVEDRVKKTASEYTKFGKIFVQ